jgi:colanic acid biosynthesis glycosyl transferase WcaI
MPSFPPAFTASGNRNCYMRILVYGLNFSPELTGIGKFTGDLAPALSQKRHSVRVVTAPPYYPEWHVGHGYSAWRYITERETDAPLIVYRSPLWVPAKPTGAKRLIHLASFAFFSVPLLLRQLIWRPDVVIVIAPAFFCAPGGWLTARLCGARAWLHIQDFEVDAAFSLGILRHNGLKRIVLCIERMVMRRFDRVSTISRRMIERLTDKGISPDRQVLFPNWVDIGLGNEADEVLVLYSGNMGEKQGMEVLLDAAELLQSEPRLRFLLCGDGASRARLESRYHHLKNVVWMELQPLDQLNALLNAADIHALPQRADAADLVMPSKLTGMMASGRPTVAAAAAGTEIAMAVEGAGLVVPPGDARAFADAVKQLAEDAPARARLGAAARQRAINTMGKDAILDRFAKDLVALVEGHP